VQTFGIAELIANHLRGHPPRIAEVGLGGVIVPFIGIKGIDVIVTALRLV